MRGCGALSRARAKKREGVPTGRVDGWSAAAPPPAAEAGRREVPEALMASGDGAICVPRSERRDGVPAYRVGGEPKSMGGGKVL